MSDSIVIIPTYNEKENIENIIRVVFGLEKEFHILIIDDGSPDGTADIVKRLQKEFPERLFMVERKGKLGFVFQSFNLIDELNVYENVELPLTYLGKKASERRCMVEEMLIRMNISHRA